MENQRTALQGTAYNNNDGEPLANVEKPSRLKSAILVTITTLFAGAFGYSLVSLIIGVNGYTLMLTATIITGLLYLSFVVLEAILLHDAASLIAGSFFQALALTTSLLMLVKNIPLILVAGTFLILMILFAMAEYAGRSELENAIKIRFGIMSGLVSRKSFLAIAIFIAVVYGFALKPAEVISQSVTKITVSASTVAIGYYISGFKADMKIGEILSDLALQGINKENGGAVAVRNLPESIRQKLIVEGSQAVKQSLEMSLGVKLNPEKTFSETVSEIVSNRIKDFASKVSQLYLSGILSVAVFLTMVTFGFAIYWVVAFVAFFVYQIFLVTGFATLILETKSKETAILE